MKCSGPISLVPGYNLAQIEQNLFTSFEKTILSVIRPRVLSTAGKTLCFNYPHEPKRGNYSLQTHKIDIKDIIQNSACLTYFPFSTTGYNNVASPQDALSWLWQLNW